MQTNWESDSRKAHLVTTEGKIAAQISNGIEQLVAWDTSNRRSLSTEAAGINNRTVYRYDGSDWQGMEIKADHKT